MKMMIWFDMDGTIEELVHCFFLVYGKHINFVGVGPVGIGLALAQYRELIQGLFVCHHHLHVSYLLLMYLLYHEGRALSSPFALLFRIFFLLVSAHLDEC